MKRIICKNPDCRNYKSAANTNFCPECKALINLKYSNSKKDWILLFACRLGCDNVSKGESATIHNAKEILWATMFHYVSIDYIKILLGFKNTSQLREVWEQSELFFGKSKLNGQNIYLITYKSIVYVFGKLISKKELK